jgi:hypothetical protein
VPDTIPEHKRWIRKRPNVVLTLAPSTSKLLGAIAVRLGVKRSHVVERLVIDEARRLGLAQAPQEEAAP